MEKNCIRCKLQPAEEAEKKKDRKKAFLFALEKLVGCCCREREVAAEKKERERYCRGDTEIGNESIWLKEFFYLDFLRKCFFSQRLSLSTGSVSFDCAVQPSALNLARHSHRCRYLHSQIQIHLQKWSSKEMTNN